jgi:polyvinyl alcohol dehydrogenase (cytochrome)
MYGHDLQHSFAVPAGCSAITPANVATLTTAWFFHTRDSITASPTISHGTVYVGAWDGRFYAINAATGAQRWTYRIKTTSPTAFGRIVSSAAVVTAGRGAERRRVVIFGGGSRVWALDAETGHKLAALNVDPRTPADRKAAKRDPRVVEVESSPAVVPAARGRDHIYVGMDVHDEPHVGRTGLLALTLDPGRRHWALRPRWKFDVETSRAYRGRAGLTKGSGHGLGCGGIWSSPAVDPARHLIVVGTASCDYPAKAYAEHRNYSEEMVALDSRSGHAVWSYRPEDSLPAAQRVPTAETDADFGASPNLFRLRDGRRVAGDGSKNATYYVRTARSGAHVTTTVAGQDGYAEGNFAVGGFLGSSGVQMAGGRAKQIIGGTAIPIPHSTSQVARSTWDVRALDPQTGKLNWAYQLGAPTYAATSVVNNIAFVPLTVQSDVVALDANTGRPLWMSPVVGPPSSNAVVAGDSLYVGTGTRETDLEYKAVNSQLQDTLKGTVGESPLSPISGVQAFRLAADLASG